MERVWSYQLLKTDWPADSLLKMAYVGFNFIEACIWFGLAIYIVIRAVRSRASHWSYGYGLGFLVFGITDLLEVDALPVSLLLFKGVVFAYLLSLRKIVLPEFPGCRF